jgi:hypothetical protein
MTATVAELAHPAGIDTALGGLLLLLAIKAG